MPNTFYFDACNVDSRMTPFPPETKNLYPGPNHPDFFVADKDEDGKLMLPHSIMNDNVAINYRTIYNGYPLFSQSANFTEYSGQQNSGHDVFRDVHHPFSKFFFHSIWYLCCKYQKKKRTKQEV